jgi:hypothetical protein
MRRNTMARIHSVPRRSRRVSLRQREALILDHSERTILVVERGCLWVTLDNDPRDIVLVEGMRFEIDRPGRTIVAAETASTLRLLVPLSLPERMASALTRALSAWAAKAVRRAAPPVRRPAA